MIRRCILLVLLAVLVAAAPAQAAPRTKAAAEFADAALRAKVAMKAGEPAAQAKLKAMRSGLCVRVTRDTLRTGNRHRFDRALAITLIGGLRPLLEGFIPVGRRMVADLDAVPTRDRALIGGREAWRQAVAAFETIPVIDRPCERLGEWRDSGYAAAQAPPYLLDELERTEDDNGEEAARRIERAVRRLRQLGVSRGAAKRFNGEELISDAYVDLDAVAGTVEPGR
jgi:hypothetical protein